MKDDCKTVEVSRVVDLQLVCASNKPSDSAESYDRYTVPRATWRTVDYCDKSVKVSCVEQKQKRARIWYSRLLPEEGWHEHLSGRLMFPMDWFFDVD